MTRLAETEIIKSVAEKVKTADGLVVGSPVYWASPSGEIISFMDRLSSLAGKDLLHKPAAAIASARRAGTTATLDVLAKYFTYHQMPVVSANYWNVVHGNTPDEVKKDADCLLRWHHDCALANCRCKGFHRSLCISRQ